MPHPLGIEPLTALGLGPVDQVTLAARLGCAKVSLRLAQVPGRLNPHGYPLWSLREDAGLRREVKAALADRGVKLTMVEGFDLSHERDVAELAADLDNAAELGAMRVKTADNGAERAQALDQLARLAAMADERGMDLCIEFAPVYTLRTLADALAAVDYAGTARAGVLIDALHFFRSRGTARALSELDPARIGHVRLSDAPRKGDGDYAEEMATGRMIPGQGELPLREFVDALPRGRGLGLLVPLVAAAASGRSPDDYVGEIVRRTRDFLA